MMTATWCGPCKMLESETLNYRWIRQFLAPFVLVQAFEDKDVEKTYGLGGYPTLAFCDSAWKTCPQVHGIPASLFLRGGSRRMRLKAQAAELPDSASAF